jgi:hypothetical protein
MCKAICCVYVQRLLVSICSSIACAAPAARSAMHCLYCCCCIIFRQWYCMLYPDASEHHWKCEARLEIQHNLCFVRAALLLLLPLLLAGAGWSCFILSSRPPAIDTLCSGVLRFRQSNNMIRSCVGMLLSCCRGERGMQGPYCFIPAVGALLPKLCRAAAAPQARGH